jgi:hypothetical protein
VYDGRIVEERLIPPGRPVTVGSDPGCTVVVARAPRRFTLIETRPGAEVLHFTAGMRGKIARAGEVSTLEGLLADGGARRGRRRSSMSLHHDHRGKVRVGDTTILFQFIRTPPMPAKRRPQRRFGAWHWGIVDWIFLAVLLLSGLIHTAALIWIESQPPPSTEAMRQLQDRFITLYVRPPEADPIPEPTALPDDLLAAASVPEPTADPEPEGVAPASDVSDTAGPIVEAPETAEERLARLEEDVADEGILALIGTTGDSKTKHRVEDLLADGTIGDAQHDALVASRVGYGRSDGAFGPRAGGGGDDPVSVGDLQDADSGVEGGRAIKESVTITGTTTTGDWKPAPGTTTSYDVHTQMRRYLGRMRACYEKQLKHDPDLAGKIVLSWTVEADGELSTVTVENDSTGSADLRSCVTRRLEAVRFAPPPYELDVEGYPLLFDRQ